MSVQQLLPVGLAFIMFSIGLGLRLDDFTRVARRPAAMAAGLVNQIVLLPAIGFAIAMSLDAAPAFLFGIMILAVCPGGITSNLLTMLAGGNTALSVSMTAVTSFASIVTVPVILGLAHAVLIGGGTDIEMPVGQVMGGIFVVTGIPLIVGMGLNVRFPAITARLYPWARKAATLMFAAIVVGAFAGNMDNITRHFVDVGLALVVLNLATMGLGFLAAWRLKLPAADGIAISLESGLQNAALAIFIAINLLGSPAMMVPAIIYALIMNVTAAVFIFALRRGYLRSAGMIGSSSTDR